METFLETAAGPVRLIRQLPEVDRNYSQQIAAAGRPTRLTGRHLRSSSLTLRSHS
jgi:hypothetical protein